MALLKKKVSAEDVEIKEGFIPKREGDPKTDTQCVHEGCFEPKAPGQTHVCAKHIRSN